MTNQGIRQAHGEEEKDDNQEEVEDVQEDVDHDQEEVNPQEVCRKPRILGHIRA